MAQYELTVFPSHFYILLFDLCSLFSKEWLIFQECLFISEVKICPTHFVLIYYFLLDVALSTS